MYVDDDRGYWLGAVQDITEIRRSAQRIVSLVYYDASTRLPNRPFFVEYLQGCIDRGDAPQPGLTVLVVELETLRRVGVGWGETVAESLLREVAARLAAMLAFATPDSPEPPSSVIDRSERAAPMLARLSEIAFAIVADAGDAAAVALARRLLTALVAPVTVTGIDILVNGRIGMAHYPAHGEDAETLVRHAIAAAQSNEPALASEIRVYRDDLDTDERDRIALEARLRRAIDNHELELWYQPKVDAIRGCVVGAEALVRWRDPREGLIGPGRFIPLAEQTGLIVPLSEQVLDLACADLRRLADLGYGELRVSVNISAAQLDQGALGLFRAAASRRRGRPFGSAIRTVDRALRRHARWFNAES